MDLRAVAISFPVFSGFGRELGEGGTLENATEKRGRFGKLLKMRDLRFAYVEFGSVLVAKRSHFENAGLIGGLRPANRMALSLIASFLPGQQSAFRSASRSCFR